MFSTRSNQRKKTFYHLWRYYNTLCTRMPLFPNLQKSVRRFRRSRSIIAIWLCNRGLCTNNNNIIIVIIIIYIYIITTQPYNIILRIFHFIVRKHSIQVLLSLLRPNTVIPIQRQRRKGQHII